MQHHTSTTPEQAGLLGSLWIDQAHHHRLVEVIRVIDDERVLMKPVRDARLKPPTYLESTEHLSGLDYRRPFPDTQGRGAWRPRSPEFDQARLRRQGQSQRAPAGRRHQRRAQAASRQRLPLPDHAAEHARAAPSARRRLHHRPMGLPNPRRDPPEAQLMSTPTLTDAGATCTQIPSGRHQPPDPGEEYQALWAMTRDDRIAAMWRSELTLRQLCQWSSRAQHEVPILAGEFAWIVMRTPEWAESTNHPGVDLEPGQHQEVNP